MSALKRLLHAILIVALVASAGPARAQDVPPSDAVARVLAARAAEDPAVLAEVAAALPGDPWPVVEELLARGEADAAAALAAASDEPRFGGLAAYVAEFAGKARPATLAEALALVGAASMRDDPEAAAADVVRAREMLGDDGGLCALAAAIELGLAHARLGERDAALALLSTATPQAERLGWLRGAANGHNGLAICAQDPLDLDALEREYTIVSSLRERVRDDVGASQAYTNLAITRTMTGNYASALPALERASELLASHADDPENAYNLAHLLMTQGAVHSRLGESANAAVALQRSLRLMPREDNDDAIAQILSDLTTAFMSLGDYDSARQFQEQLRAVEERRGDPLGVGSALTLRGAIDLESGRVSAARDALTRARRLMSEAGSVEGALLVDLDIARVFEASGEFEQAVELVSSVVEAMKREGLEMAVAFALNAKGDALAALRRFDEALAAHATGLETARRLGQTDEVVRNLTGVARARLALGEHEEAMEAAREAIADQAALVRNAAADQAPRARALRGEVYEIGVRAARAASDAASLCFFIESGRAGALLETMRSRDAFRTAIVPEALQAEVLRLRRETADAQSAVRDAYDEGAKLKELRALVTAQREAEAREREVEAEIERGRRFGASMLYPKAAELPDLSAALGPRDALVLFSVMSDDALALVVTPGDAPARIVELGPTDEIRARATALLDLASVRGTVPTDVAAVRAATSALREAVIRPLAIPQGTERVLISPDGPLAHVPFGLLIDDAEIVFVPSGTALLTLAASPATGATAILGLGDPAYDRASRLARLPASRSEVEALPDPAVRLLGDDATAGSLRRELAAAPGWRAVHFACHGLVADDPWQAALALTPDTTGNGRLTALDVVGMSIPADLVVLSACESGRGKVLRGEGIVGLTHGFLGAGARRVVVGLWQVDDEATRAFMAAFYAAWDGADGADVSVARALRIAQAAVRAEEKWRHPYYWAAWVEWGAPG